MSAEDERKQHGNDRFGGVAKVMPAVQFIFAVHSPKSSCLPRFDTPSAMHECSTGTIDLFRVSANNRRAEKPVGHRERLAVEDLVALKVQPNIASFHI